MHYLRLSLNERSRSVTQVGGVTDGDGSFRQSSCAFRYFSILIFFLAGIVFLKRCMAIWRKISSAFYLLKTEFMANENSHFCGPPCLTIDVDFPRSHVFWSPKSLQVKKNERKSESVQRRSFLSSAFSMTPHNSYSCRCSKLSHVVPPFIIFEKGCKRR